MQPAAGGKSRNLFDRAAFGDLCLRSAGGSQLARLHELANVTVARRLASWATCIRGDDVRLQEAVAPFKLLVFAAHRLDAVDDAEKAGLEGFGLPGRAAWLVRGKQPRGGAATHCIRASRASWLIFSISSLVLRGLMVRASFSSYSSSSSPSST